MIAKINLNQENYNLLLTLSPIVNSSVSLGGMHIIEVTQDQLTGLMKDMSDNEDYKYLKEHLQTIGKEFFGW